MRYRYFICDVFSEVRFGGNQLAVLPEAAGLSDRQMQQIAREFNFSESAFVFPAAADYTRKVRIFTPTTEIPFAGHPNIGTAFVLAAAGEFGEINNSISVTFEEKAGPVAISIEKRGNRLWCELSAPERLSLGKTISAELLAAAVSLAPEEIVTRTHRPQAASVGLPFLIAELRDRMALERARANIEKLSELVNEDVPAAVHLYTQSADEFEIRARMFAPLDGVPEDPATGSANCALAGLLAHYHEAEAGVFHWRIAQGVEMGRPSVLEARAEKKDRIVTQTWIGGGSVLVSEGLIEADPA